MTALTDGDPATYWATDDGVTEASVVVDFGKPTTFNSVDVREHLPLGQRVEAFTVEAWENGDWVKLADGTSIGNRRLLWLKPVTAERMRFRVSKAAAAPAISELGVYAEPLAPAGS
jgi:alpha-L-fucosidase